MVNNTFELYTLYILFSYLLFSGLFTYRKLSLNRFFRLSPMKENSKIIFDYTLIHATDQAGSDGVLQMALRPCFFNINFLFLPSGANQ